MERLSDVQSEKRAESQQSIETTCCIVGSGPAGAMLALLLARQDIPVVLLEAHGNFDRDFRGDTIHPSTLTILDEIGLAESLLQQIRHTKMSSISVETADGPVTIADLSWLKMKYPYIALLPQVDFLQFITDEAKKYPAFRLMMGVQVNELIEEQGRVQGVYYQGSEGSGEIRAVLTVGTDGRFSRLRKLAGFEPIKTSPPMDVLWFRVSRRADDADQPLGRFVGGRILIMLNRDEYWQVGWVTPKGKYQEVRAAGLEAFKQAIATALPLLADRVDEIHEWKQLSPLVVESSRVARWYRPGLLLIGDAAHVMSPVGGVGINYAVQDAVVAANVLAGKLKYGIAQTQDLARVQRQRELPTRFIQNMQRMLQNQLLAPALKADRPVALPFWMRYLLRIPLLRALPGRFIAVGLKQVHVETD